jgi:D-glycero-alpha-D-manno-heptose-7-phosphate kinase
MTMLTDATPSPPEARLGQVAPNAVIRARAPLRISFCGGGTDLMPYARDHGGLVLSATIARHAYATLRLTADPAIRVQSLDYNMIASFGLDEPLIYDGKFDLIKACLRRLRMGSEANRIGLDLYLETDAPPGSGLGASSALVVAVIGTFKTWLGLNLSRYEIADLAYDLERKDVGIAGGMQDQYAATFGGFNLMEFHDEHDVVVNPLRVDSHVVHELEYNSLLVFTGGTRLSSRIIDSQVEHYTAGNRAVIDAMGNMKQLAHEAKAALLRGRVLDLGEILHEQWLHKKATSAAVSTAQIDLLYQEARKHGALGGKMSGAGGGGFMFLLCPFDRKPAVIARLTELGAQVSPVEFESEGMQSWLAGPMTATAKATAA